MVDGAQSAPHFAVDVQAMDCDFFAFSGHKMYGPTGVGVLYGKEDWLDRLPPYQGGGEMIESVSFERTVFERLPFKFEAGTPDYVATNGLAKAIDYITALGMDNIRQHEHELTEYAMRRLAEVDGIRIFGTSARKDAVVSFLVGDIHHLDMGTLLGPPRHSRAHGPPLRPAPHAAPRHTGHGARLVRTIQHEGGNRRACRRNQACQQDVLI